MHTVQHNEILQRILASDTFSHSAINRELLSYLAHSAQKGKTPREINIATEVLGRDKNFDPSSDPYVRTCIYNLRKRLDQYYEKEGKKDANRLVIPKGSYQVRYVKQNKKTTASGKKTAIIVLLALLAISLLFNIWLAIMSPAPKIAASASHPFWRDLMQNDMPTLLVVGDFLTFTEYDAALGRFRSIRDHSINSMQQFENYQKTTPTRQATIEKDYRSFDWTTVENNLALASVFWQAGKNVLIKRSSKLQWDDIRSHNIVFQGSPLSLNILNSMLDMTHFRTGVDNPETRACFYKLGEARDTVAVLKPTGIPTGDNKLEGYVLLAKLPGPNKNSILLLVGNFEMTRTYLLRQLSTKDYLKDLYARMNDSLGHVPDYFEVMFKIKGFPRTGIREEIIYIGEI